MTITAAQLVEAYPEWSQVNLEHPGVVTQAITQAVNRIDEDVVGDRYDECLMLSAGTWLYSHPYSRDMRESSDAASNPYKLQLDEILHQKGSAWRTVWSTCDFGSWL